MHVPSQDEQHLALAAAKKPKFTVVQHSAGNVAGIWIAEDGKATPSVAIYFTEQDGPVIGLYGNTHNPLACAAALSADKTTGEGVLQLTTEKGGVVHLTGTQLEKLVKFLDTLK